MKSFANAFQPLAAVGPVALVVGETETVLQLRFLYHFEHLDGECLRNRHRLCGLGRLSGDWIHDFSTVVIQSKQHNAILKVILVYLKYYTHTDLEMMTQHTCRKKEPLIES